MRGTIEFRRRQPANIVVSLQVPHEVVNEVGSGNCAPGAEFRRNRHPETSGRAEEALLVYLMVEANSNLWRRDLQQVRNLGGGHDHSPSGEQPIGQI